MLLLNNNLNVYSQPEVTVKQVIVTLGIYSLENPEWENVLVAPSTNTENGLLLTVQEESWETDNILKYVAETKTCLYG